MGEHAVRMLLENGYEDVSQRDAAQTEMSRRSNRGEVPPSGAGEITREIALKGWSDGCDHGLDVRAGQWLHLGEVPDEGEADDL